MIASAIPRSTIRTIIAHFRVNVLKALLCSSGVCTVSFAGDELLGASGAICGGGRVVLRNPCEIGWSDGGVGAGGGVFGFGAANTSSRFTNFGIYGIDGEAVGTTGGSITSCIVCASLCTEGAICTSFFPDLPLELSLDSLICLHASVLLLLEENS